MLLKAAPIRRSSRGVKQIPHTLCEFGDEIYLYIIAEGDPAPPDLLDVTQCQSTGQEVLYRGMWMPFCNCHGGQDCLNPFTATREIAQPAEEETEKDYIDSNLPDDSDNTKEETESDYIDSNLSDGSDDGLDQTLRMGCS